MRLATALSNFRAIFYSISLTCLIILGPVQKMPCHSSIVPVSSAQSILSNPNQIVFGKQKRTDAAERLKCVEPKLKIFINAIWMEIFSLRDSGCIQKRPYVRDVGATRNGITRQSQAIRIVRKLIVASN